jgi:DNA-binding MarR family transcriptional regulator
MNENYYEKLGELVIASRLRRLSERFILEMGNIYKSQNIDFEPGWFHIMYLLSENTKMSITQISETLNVSHPSVIQVVKVLEKKNIVCTNIDETDNRRRILELTENGKTLLKKIQPIWSEIDKQMANFLAEGEYSKNFLNGITEIEENLEKKSMVERLNLGR